MTGHYTLPSGMECDLLEPHMTGVPHYHVLAAASEAGDRELEEFAGLAASLARRIGRELYADDEAFTLLLNGSLTGRRPWVHAHIIPANTPLAKHRALAFLVLKRPIRLVKQLRPRLTPRRAAL